MRLRYGRKDGTQMEFELGERPITIGRSPEADVVLLDDKASRIHCGIRLWDGEFYIKDLKSRNGTYVNDQRIDVAKLRAGDIIRVGSAIFSFEQDTGKQTGMALLEIEEQMAEGQGYSTILRQIVNDAGQDESEPIPIKPRKPKTSS